MCHYLPAVMYASTKEYGLAPKILMSSNTGSTWTSIQDIQEMAFDHFEIFSSALNRLQERVRLRPIGFELLPEEFTLAQLQHLYEKLLNQTFDTEKAKKINLDKKKFSSGKYKLVLNTKDKYGEAIELIKYFDVFDTSDKNTTKNTAFFHHLEKI